MCADGWPSPSKSPKVFQEETLGLDFRSSGVALMDLGLGWVSITPCFFAGGFCQAFGLGLRAERFADLPVVAEGVEDAAYAPGVFGPYGADDGGSGRYGAVEGGVGVFDGEDHADRCALGMILEAICETSFGGSAGKSLEAISNPV
jgi:hypothetical protein